MKDRDTVIKELKERAKYEREHRTEILIDRLKKMRKFTDDYIPEPPITDKDTYERYVIPNYVRCGALPKHKLINGKTYIGSCRNADRAVWLGDKFEYTRYKFGDTFQERIKHFEDAQGSEDVFVPIREIDPE